MTLQHNRLYARFTSYLFMGIFLLLLIAGLIFFSYLFIIGAIIGLVLFIIAWIRMKVFKCQLKSKFRSQRHNDAKIHRGRTIDHE